MSGSLNISERPFKMKVKGMQAAVEMLKEFTTDEQKKAVLEVQRKALRPIPRDARARLGGYSNRVSRSIKIWQPRGARKRENPALFVGVKSNWKGYGDPKDPWFAHMIEYGSEGIKRKTRPSGSTGRDDQQTPFRVRLANIPKGKRFRTDQPARPFMQPAIESNQERVSKVLIDDMSANIQKVVQKHKK
jgi:HK97 gp10 family phage protein